MMKCNLCDYETKRKFNLDRHIKKHNKENSSFSCEVCKYTTNEKHNLLRHLKSKKHIRNTTEPQEIIYNCDHDDCNYKTEKKCLLNKHMKSHDDYETHTYKCLLCNKTFRDKERYNKHSTGNRHGRNTSKLIATIKKVLQEKHKNLGNSYYNELSLQKQKMRMNAFIKLDEPVKVKKNNNKRKVSKKKDTTFKQLVNNINVVEPWTLEEWKEQQNFAEQATVDMVLLLFEQLKIVDKQKPEMNYLDTYEDEFKNIDKKSEEELINIYYGIIDDIIYDFENY